MGQPAYLSAKNVEQLKDASQLLKERQSFTYEDGTMFLKTELPPHAVAAITITFALNQS
jgi:hypothetical protein